MASPSPAEYRRRAPESGLHHRILRDHLESLVEGAKDPDDPEAGLPLFVERELRSVIPCGSLSAGFIRWRCAACHFERIVALSCKARATCPSCGARRMFETAARLVTEVLPDVPIRQFVLAPPWDLRLALAAKPDLLTAMTRIFIETVFRWLETNVREDHGVKGARCGAVVVIQRFSSSLMVFPHVHALVLDGAYAKTDADAPPVFHPARAPSAADEQAISYGVATRISALLVRRGMVGGDTSTEPRTTLEKWFLAAAQERAQLGAVDGHGRSTARRSPHPWLRDREDASTGLSMGFSVHARTCVRAGDKEGRERLSKYVARPAFAESQLSETEDGRVAFGTCQRP